MLKQVGVERLRQVAPGLGVERGYLNKVVNS